MLEMLAATTSANEGMSGWDIAGWLLALFAIAGGANQVLQLLDRQKEQPEPSKTYSRITDLDALRKATNARIDLVQHQVDEMSGKLDDSINGLRGDLAESRDASEERWREVDEKDEERATKIHNRINPIESALSELKGQMESDTKHMTRQISNVDAKLDRLIERRNP